MYCKLSCAQIPSQESNNNQKQEFHELEILDEITTLAYNSKLLEQINGQIRNAKIRQFQEWKGPNYVDGRVHKATVWSLNKPYKLLPVGYQ